MATTEENRKALKGINGLSRPIDGNISLIGVSGYTEEPTKISHDALEAFIKSVSGDTDAVKTTYLEAQTAVAAKTLIPNQLYEITDATQAQAGGKGSVFAFTLSNEVFSPNAIWKINSDFKGFGWIDMAGTMMTADNVASISVDGVNQLSSPVAFATTYDALAIAVAGEINGNAAASYTAKAIKNRVVLKNKLRGVDPNNDIVAAVGTNLVPTNATPITNGQEEETLYLVSNYDFTKNQIYKTYYNYSNVTFSVDDFQISTLGYNPVYYFPFGDKNSGYGSGRDTFENATFTGQSFKDVYYTKSWFNDSYFHGGCIWTVTNGCVLVNSALEYSEFIRGTINMSGTTMSFSTGKYFNFSRMLFTDDSIINISNCELGGAGVAFGRSLKNFMVNISGGTFFPSAEAGFSGSGYFLFEMTNINFTGRVNVNVKNKLIINANGILGSSIINITQNSGDDFTLTLTNSNFVSINISGKINKSVLDLSNQDFANLNMNNIDINYFDITNPVDNAGFDINLNNSSFSHGALVIPTLTKDFYMNNTVWQGNNFSFDTTLTLDGTAGKGAVGALTIFQDLPDNFFPTYSLSEGVSFAGTATISIGSSGAVTTIIPVTLGTGLNAIIEHTVTTTKTTAVTTVEGAVAIAVANAGTLKLWVQGKIGL